MLHNRISSISQAPRPHAFPSFAAAGGCGGTGPTKRLIRIIECACTTFEEGGGGHTLARTRRHYGPQAATTSLSVSHTSMRWLTPPASEFQELKPKVKPKLHAADSQRSMRLRTSHHPSVRQERGVLACARGAAPQTCQPHVAQQITAMMRPPAKTESQGRQSNDCSQNRLLPACLTDRSDGQRQARPDSKNHPAAPILKTNGLQKKSPAATRCTSTSRFASPGGVHPHNKKRGS